MAIPAILLLFRNPGAPGILRNPTHSSGGIISLNLQGLVALLY